VTIRLAPKQTMRQLMLRSLRVPHAAHTVKGHFAHFNQRDGCEHAWPTMPNVGDDNVPRWHCTCCSGLRVWKNDYHTSNGTVGFTTTEYAVKRWRRSS
jgi:hypothetical protein